MQPGKFFCISTKDREGTWRDHFFTPAKFKDIDGFVKDNIDKDIYWCPHGFIKPRRLKKYAAIPKLLWADLDEANPKEMDDLMPTIAWESSPGRYAALWVLDADMIEDVNRRLTYHLKADPGGWDLTQVLRLPGTSNFKYPSTPKVKLLWADGPSYTLEAIMQLLPKERKVRETDVARGLYRKYEKDMSSWCRRQLMKGKPKQGKRSEVFWRLVNELIEAGCSHDQAFELLRVSPWNKFSKRRDGDEQLRREIEKATSRHLRVVNDEDPQAGVDSDEVDEEDERDRDEPWRPLAKPLSEVEEEQLDWIWYPYLARGEMTILEGDPGLGKSYLAQMVSKGLTDGEVLPSVKKMPAIEGVVAYFDMENSVATVTKKRMADNGMKRMDRFFQEETPFSIDDEDAVSTVYDALRTRKPVLAVFDTLNTYIGKADIHNSAESQQALNTFVEIAKRFQCAVLVLRHLTKNTKTSSLYRGQGSIAFAGKARVVITVGQSPDDPDTRVAAVTKINVARRPKALTFKIEELPDTLRQQDRSKFIWGDFVDLTVDDIIAQEKEEKRRGDAKDTSLEDAKKWLTDQLSDGACLAKELKRSGDARSFDDKLLEKAATALKLVRDDGWWAMPDED
jgi:archaellum biogenesis ATPase FlaH